MRRAFVFTLALMALAATPSASAATFDLGASKIIEHALEPGKDIVFEMPLTVNQDGSLYAKVLPTPGNAVNDGSKANGSVLDGRGWRVSFAMVLAGGERVEMGTFVDSTLSKLIPVKIGDKPTLVATVHVASDAARGGPQQKVYVAIAYRLGGAGVGTASGGAIDEARALTLVLSNALLPPAAIEAATPEAETETTPAAAGSETDTAPTPEGAGSLPEQDGSEEATSSTEQESTVPAVAPVAPIATGRSGAVSVNVEPLPAWFLAGVLGVGAMLALALAVMSIALYGLVRALRREQNEEAARVVPVQAARAATESRRSESVPAAEE